METSINQIKTAVVSIISKPDQAEERLSQMEDKIKEILHTDNDKKSAYLWLQNTRKKQLTVCVCRKQVLSADNVNWLTFFHRAWD